MLTTGTGYIHEMVIHDISLISAGIPINIQSPPQIFSAPLPESYFDIHAKQTYQV